MLICQTVLPISAWRNCVRGSLKIFAVLLHIAITCEKVIDFSQRVASLIHKPRSDENAEERANHVFIRTTKTPASQAYSYSLQRHSISSDYAAPEKYNHIENCRKVFSQTSDEQYDSALFGK